MYTVSVPSLHIISASTSGHTDYVIGELVAFLREKVPGVVISLQRAEQAAPEDLLRGDVLLLASGTWNTGGVEGQLNPHMHAFLKERAKDVALGGKKVAIVALGDDRYYYTTRAGEHLRVFAQGHGGTVVEPPLLIVNEPYGQEERVRSWAKKLLTLLAS